MATRINDYSAWEEHRDLIHTLYIVEKRSQDEVLDILKSPPYGLDAT